MADMEDSLRRLRELTQQSAEHSERFKKESAARGAEIDRKLEDLSRTVDKGVRRIRVNKKTHCVRFEDETEDQVTIIVERKT